MKNKKIFLGGTCSNSTWRKDLIPLLKENNIDYFNPMKENWTEEMAKKELEEREKCDFNLYVIEDLSLYSIAEVVDDSNKRPKKTFLLFFESKFNNKQLKAIQHIEEMVRNNGSYIIKDFNELIDYLTKLKH